MTRALFAIVGLIGLAVVAWAAWLLYHGWVSTTWPAAPGRVVSAVIQHSRGSADPSRVGTPTASAAVTYVYDVGDQSYRGTTISYGAFFSSTIGDDTATYVLRYRPGARVEVHYDPANPAEAVLEPGLTGSMFVLLAIGIVLALIGVALPAAAARAEGT
jgi:Protein of unknown function (DUF3592)